MGKVENALAEEGQQSYINWLLEDGIFEDYQMSYPTYPNDN